jgi:hypothetical protein
MASDSFFFNVLREAGYVLLRCAGFTDLSTQPAGLYVVQALSQTAKVVLAR